MSGSVLRALICALTILFGLVAAQDTSIVIPTTAASSATPLPSVGGYSYAGCWNETTNVANAGGVRALGESGNVVSILHPYSQAYLPILICRYSSP